MAFDPYWEWLGHSVGRRLMAISDDGAIRQWDVQTGLPAWDRPAMVKGP